MPSKPVAPPDTDTIGAQPRGAPRVRLIARTSPPLQQPRETPRVESSPELAPRIRHRLPDAGLPNHLQVGRIRRHRRRRIDGCARRSMQRSISGLSAGRRKQGLNRRTRTGRLCTM
jgi:hypothetical protein